MNATAPAPTLGLPHVSPHAAVDKGQLSRYATVCGGTSPVFETCDLAARLHLGPPNRPLKLPAQSELRGDLAHLLPLLRHSPGPATILSGSFPSARLMTWLERLGAGDPTPGRLPSAV